MGYSSAALTVLLSVTFWEKRGMEKTPIAPGRWCNKLQVRQCIDSTVLLLQQQFHCLGDGRSFRQGLELDML